MQAWRRKEARGFKGGEAARDLGKQMAILSLWREVELSKDMRRMVRSVERGGRMYDGPEGAVR